MTAAGDATTAAMPDSVLAGLWRPSPNHEPRRGGRRPDMLLLHYTGMACAQAALDWLTRPESRVSCHYLVDERGTIVQMVRESRRAWHAGLSHWAGDSDINSCSIGIEIHNPGHDLGYADFPEAQMAAVEALARDIVARHAIPPARVLAHSDVAPARKRDPGERFDWARLARAGIGLWVEADDGGEGAGLPMAELQARLRAFGYGLEMTGVEDEATRTVVAAFQRHWRPARVDGRADASTCAVLDRLLVAAGRAA